MRIFSSTMQALLLKARLRVTFIARLYLKSGTVGASDAAATFTWDNGQGDGPITFGGFGDAFRMSVPPSTSVLDAGSTTGAMTLSGTDPTILASFLGENYRAQRVDNGVLFFDPDANVPVEEQVAFRGIMDTSSITDSAADALDPEKPVTSTLSVLVQSRTVDLSRKGTRTRSDADQRLHRDPNDAFFQDVGLVAQAQINWDRGGPASPAMIAGLPLRR